MSVTSNELNSEEIVKHTFAENILDRMAAQMVDQQVRTREVFDDDVLDVMQSVPREKFLNGKFASFAHTDSSFQIRENFLLPAPSVQGKVLQALSIESDASILQIGAGCGYLSACLAELGGYVYIADKDSKVLEQIKQTCTDLNISNVNPVTHTFENLFSDIENTYDAIVMQHALPNVPVELKQALRDNGVAVLFIGRAPTMRCVRIERIGQSEWLEEELFETVVAPFPIAYKEKVTFSF